MAIYSENSVHTRLLLLHLSFAQNGSKELVTACGDDSGMLQIVLVPSPSYSGHANVKSTLLSVKEDALVNCVHFSTT